MESNLNRQFKKQQGSLFVVICTSSVIPVALTFIVIFKFMYILGYL